MKKKIGALRRKWAFGTAVVEEAREVRPFLGGKMPLEMMTKHAPRSNEEKEDKSLLEIQGVEQKISTEGKSSSSGDELGNKNNEKKDKMGGSLRNEVITSKTYEGTLATNEKKSKAEEIRNQTSGKETEGLMREANAKVDKKKQKCGTFKRFERTNRSQPCSVSEPDQKKRGAVAMEIEEEADNVKRAKMVVDSEGGKVIQVNISPVVTSENGQETENVIVEHRLDMKAGLTDQSRGTE